MSAVHQLITDHLDIWTAADTEKKSGRGRASGNANSVYGIKKLRELILELAVRGKLVPQDPNDEPAYELVKRIQEDRTKLLPESKQRKSKLTTFGSTNLNFPLPTNWFALRFDEIFSLEYGDNLPADKRSNSGEYPVYGSNGVVGTHNICFTESPCIVIGRKGSAGALNLCLEAGCCVTDVAYFCIPPKHVSLFFTFKLFHTLKLEELGKGIKPGLNRNEVYVLPVAIPPIQEQHRIVAKVDELMALCDQLEAQHNNAADAHEQLVSHLLSTLTQSQDAADFNANWQRIATHFDTLFTTESSIDALKQTLLQLAVMGKLVPQDPNDEPASELLKRIQAEKAKLVAEGKIKKEKAFAEISENEKKFDLPTLWSWMRLGFIAELTGGIAFQSNKFLESGNNQVIRIGNVRPGNLRLDQKSVFIGNETVTNFRASPLSAGDLIITMTGTVGKRDYVYSAIIHDEYLANKSLFLNQRLCSVRPFLVSPLYLDLAMKDDRLLDAIFSSATGTANQANISMAALNLWTLPLPPIAEQHRIVSKFNELMILCDQLISNINIGNRLQLKLADTLVEHAIS